MKGLMGVKKLIYVLILILIFFFTFSYRENILSYATKNYENLFFTPSKLEKNEYTRSYNFKYVQNTDTFIPNNKQDILNIFYTVVNSGMDEFSFYCKSEYENCLNDVNDIIKNQNIVSNINNFVHPYNTCKDFKTDVYKYGKITIKSNKLYDSYMIDNVNFEIEKIINENINDKMTDKEKIKTIHDYIINHTKYDQDRSDKKIIKYKSDTAFGALKEGYALCGGYADSMMLFLEKFGIKNYKIASENHVWNYVFLDNEWYHLDLTWDDPVNKEGKDILDYSYFLITDKDLEKLDKSYHTYDKTVYLQLN